MIKHIDRKHALLSASGASRWMNCTPSARLEETLPDKGTSVFAAEGTLAHEFGDLQLRFFNKEITKQKLNTELKKLRGHELYALEMEGEVEKYTSYVIEEFHSSKEGAELMVERRLDFSHIVEDGFGTGDTTIAADDTLDVIDLKYGMGIKVYADHNEQLMLYGIGALRMVDLLYDIKTVRLHIVQPRLDHISVWEISAEELRAWGEEEVKVKANIAFKGEGEQIPGDWCKWCKVKPKCAALAKQSMSLAKFDFKDPSMLTDEEILEVKEKQELLVEWSKSVTEYMHKEAVGGKKWAGFKLVEGRSNRKWRSEEETAKFLKENGFEEKDFMQTKLKGITAVSKLAGKLELGDLMEKPQGAPTLVAETDPRSEMGGVAGAREDFA